MMEILTAPIMRIFPFYRLKRSLGLGQGSIFTSVCHSVHMGGGGGVYPNMQWGEYTPWADTS